MAWSGQYALLSLSLNVFFFFYVFDVLICAKFCLALPAGANGILGSNSDRSALILLLSEEDRHCVRADRLSTLPPLERDTFLNVSPWKTNTKLSLNHRRLYYKGGLSAHQSNFMADSGFSVFCKPGIYIFLPVNITANIKNCLLRTFMFVSLFIDICIMLNPNYKNCKNYVKKNTTTQKPAELSTEDKKKKR